MIYTLNNTIRTLNNWGQLHRKLTIEQTRGKPTSLDLLFDSFSSHFAEAFTSVLSTLVLITVLLSLTGVCPPLATGCLSLAPDCRTSRTMLAVPAFLSSDELVAMEAARTSAAIDRAGEDFFSNFLKNRLPEDILFFSSLSLSSFKVNLPSLFEETFKINTFCYYSLFKNKIKFRVWAITKLI